MNVYDFDKTICSRDSSEMFVRYCLKKYPLQVIPSLLNAGIYYLFSGGKRDTARLKERIFSFLPYLKAPYDTVNCFWSAHEYMINSWYYDRHRPDDLIISASPEFLVAPMAEKLGASLLGTVMDIRSGKITGKNCHDTEKVRRFREAFPDAEVQDFYSDSYSDSPMAEIAKRAFLVKRGKPGLWK